MHSFLLALQLQLLISSKKGPCRGKGAKRSHINKLQRDISIYLDDVQGGPFVRIVELGCFWLFNLLPGTSPVRPKLSEWARLWNIINLVTQPNL